MRLWSLHPKYLDKMGLLGVWREGLLAKNVLLGNTKGYKHHPQLLRFQKINTPIEAINFYLQIIYKEAENRKYKFDDSKILFDTKTNNILLSIGQLNYEKTHLLKKLKIRDSIKYNELLEEKTVATHPIFTLVDGEIEPWEKIKLTETNQV